MIDSHCHLADAAFDGDLADVVERARAAGLAHALVILAAGDEAESTRAARLAELWDGVRFAIGVHPHQAKDFAGRAGEIEAVLEAALAANARIRAIGEVGLDYHYDFSPRDVQHAVFRAQVAFARDRGLPLVIHTREATADTFAVLRETGQGRVRGVFHCFTGDAAMAREALAIGFHISFAGIITFPKAPELRHIAAWVPEGQFLIETDAPYLAPVPHRGKRNEPAWVTRVAEVIAEQRGVTRETIAAQALANFSALFAP